MMLAAASQPLGQVMTFAAAALLMIATGLSKRRLEWRRPHRPRRRRRFRNDSPPTPRR
jgi:hypothetical protein